MSAAVRTMFTRSVSAAYCYQVTLVTLRDGMSEVFALLLRKMKVRS